MNYRVMKRIINGERIDKRSEQRANERIEGLNRRANERIEGLNRRANERIKRLLNSNNVGIALNELEGSGKLKNKYL